MVRAKKAHTGDDDLPRREPLHERRARFDAVAARKGAKASREGEDADGDGGMDGFEDDFFGGGGASKRKQQAGSGKGDEDEFYTQAKVRGA